MKARWQQWGAAISLTLWFGLSGFLPRVGYTRDVLRTAVDLGPWTASGPLALWLFAGVTCVFALWWNRRHLNDASGTMQTVRERHADLARLVLCLVGLRLVSLWNPVGHVLPWIGLLWSPHANWAVGLTAVTCLLPCGYRPGSPKLDRHIAAGLFAVMSLAYGGYATYHCQMTMLHGDEGHYLLVTQSLLHDGDVNLADDLERTTTDEFHTIPFGPNVAPSSPAGKVISLHPVGLSALLLPAYGVGLALWNNPRLACSLFMALLAAACVAIGYLWLRRLACNRLPSLACAGAAATTPPLALFSNQLYPDLPGALIGFIVLWAALPWPSGDDHPPPANGPVSLVLLAGLVSALPFLHPRLLALAAPLAGLLLWRTWCEARMPLRAAVAGVFTLSAIAFVAYNLHISDDWLGHLRPGNALPQLSLAVLVHTLPGQWLQVSQGLLNCSPVYLWALAGWGLMAWDRDRRLVIAAILFAVTAVVNGTLDHWATVFTLPGRFLITAMPALWLGLAIGIERAGRSMFGRLLLFGTLTIAWESVLITAVVPENAYQGRNLLFRNINLFYPWDAWFSERTQVPFSSIGLWLAGIGIIVVLLRASLSRWQKAALAAALLLLPALAGLPNGMLARISQTTTPRVPDVVAGEIGDVMSRASDLTVSYRPTVGDQGLGSVSLSSETAGFLVSYRLPVLRPGAGRLDLDHVSVTTPAGGSAGSIFVSQRRVLAMVAPWETRHAWSLQEPLHNVSFAFMFPLFRNIAGAAVVEYSGRGTIAVDQRIRLTVHPVPGRLHSRHVAVALLTDGTSAPIRLPPGRYRAHFNIDGTDWTAWTQRVSAPVIMAVYGMVESRREELIWSARAWFKTSRHVMGTVTHPRFRRPHVEKIEAPWWTTVPLAHAYALEFVLDEEQDILFLMDYRGDAGLTCPDVRVDLMCIPPGARGGIGFTFVSVPSIVPP